MKIQLAILHFLLTRTAAISDPNVQNIYATGCRRQQQADDYFNRQYFHITSKHISYDLFLSHPPTINNVMSDEGMNQVCRQRRRHSLKEYTKEDVVNCFDSLSVKRNGRRMHIAFVGDSVMRQNFLSFLRFIPDYDREMESTSTTFAEYYFHENRNVTSWLLGNLLISFHWRNLIRHDLITDFNRWATAEDSQSPDLIFIGVTAHHLGVNNVTNSLDMYMELLKRDLIPAINQSLTVHPHQEIVWLRQSPTIDYMGPIGNRIVGRDNVYAEKILMYNEAIGRALRDTRVVILDAVNAIVEEYIRACSQTRLQRHDKTRYVNCNDFIHPGFGAIAITSQLIINHICSSIIN